MAIRKNGLMYRLFGKTPGHTCRECSNFTKGRYHDKTLCKCKVYGLTHSAASDWAQRWEACGMFNKPWGKGPIIREVKPTWTKQEDEQKIPLDGQMKMEEMYGI